MSEKKAKSVRKKSPKAEKEKGSRVPKVDPNRQRATIQQLNNAVNFLFGRIQDLDKRVGEAFQQFWKNEQELKAGMDSSEFNLRSHQKVLNGVCVDVRTLGDYLYQLTEKTHPELVPLPTAPSALYMVDVTITPATETAPAETSPRVNWALYHAEVERDLLELAAIERAKAEKQAKKDAMDRAVKKAEDDLAAMVVAAKDAGNDPAEVEAEAKKLLDRTRVLAEELGKALRGEPFDQTVIDEAEKFIAEVEGSKAKEEAPPPVEPLPDPNAELPEGASVFGG